MTRPAAARTLGRCAHRSFAGWSPDRHPRVDTAPIASPAIDLRGIPMRKMVLLGLSVLAVLGATTAAGAGGNGNDKTFEYAIGLWGDLPYSNVQETAGIPNLIDDTNDAQLAFSVLHGHLKAGNGPSGNPPSVFCDDALYQRALGWFNSLEGAAMFTPGDNDWTDCDRTSNGPFNSLERLQHERSVFFSTDDSLGTKPMKLEVQSTPLCLGTTSSTGSPTFNTPCVENRRWTLKNVTYATLNVQGTCNNLCSSGVGDPTDPGAQAARVAEYTARNAADIAWLESTFAQAKANGSAAVMIIAQANPGFDLSDPTRAALRDPRTLAEQTQTGCCPTNTYPAATPDGYVSFLTALRTQVIAFAKPVVYVHGDSHYFRVDKPLLDTQGRRLENFTRVETFGDNALNGTNDVHWVKALVDPQSRDVFSFQPQIVPANRPAVPAP